MPQNKAYVNSVGPYVDHEYRLEKYQIKYISDARLLWKGLELPIFHLFKEVLINFVHPSRLNSLMAHTVDKTTKSYRPMKALVEVR